ncbi:DNA pilot protein [Microvirus mar30]|uniref:DNA pilot protein n=1 Tax=Microvirus mar30 TaxID=2851164 RepID=A0A8F5MLJ8_9VIRU|nr:DNA pilot protein [Microvirus mar30]
MSVKSWNKNISAKLKNYDKKGTKYYTSVDSSGRMHYSIYNQDVANAYAQNYTNRYVKQQTDADYNRLVADNQASAKTQMDFQERMSSTSHQREVKDLIAAGLNPVLSANAGASTPAGAYGAVDSAPINANAQSRLQLRILDKQLQNQLDINRAQLAAQQAMNKYSTDVGAQVSLENARVSAAASRYASNQAAAASIYGSNVSASASRYASDNSYSSSKYGTDVGSKGFTIGPHGVSGNLSGFYGAAKSIYQAVSKYYKNKASSRAEYNKSKKK